MTANATAGCTTHDVRRAAVVAGHSASATKAIVAVTPCALDPPLCSGKAATPSVATPASASVARLSGRSTDSPAAVTRCATPTPTKPAVMIQRWGVPSAASALMVWMTASKSPGWTACASNHPPIRRTGAASDDTTAHHGGCPIRFT